MPLVVTDDPPDPPAWIAETIRLQSDLLRRERRRLLDLVARAPDADLVAGSDEEWGTGQVAVHLLIVERGVLGISLRLAAGEAPGPTGQPRVAAAEVTRAGIAALAEKTEAALARYVAAFPGAPALGATAAHPFFGPLNAVGWLLTLGNHYAAHLGALERGDRSVL